MINDVSWDELKVLKEIKDDQYKIDEEELNEYAQYIGLDLPDDNDLLYIAIEGLTINLPQQWQACHTPDGQLVYRNLITRKIQEEHPLDEYYRDKVQEAKLLKRGEMPTIPEQPYGQSEVFEKNQSFNRQNISIPGILDRNITQLSDLQEKSIQQSSLKPSDNGLNPLKKNYINQQLSLESEIQLPKIKIISSTHSAQLKFQRQPKQQHTQQKTTQNAHKREFEKKIKKMRLKEIQKQIGLKKQLLKQLQEANQHKQKLLKKILSKKNKQIKQIHENSQDDLKQLPI